MSDVPQPTEPPPSGAAAPRVAKLDGIVPVEGEKLRLVCSGCATKCEVQIPALASKKPVRFQIKCPKCSTLNELRTSKPKPPDPSGSGTTAVKRKALEGGEEGEAKRSAVAAAPPATTAPVTTRPPSHPSTAAPAAAPRPPTAAASSSSSWQQPAAPSLSKSAQRQRARGGSRGGRAAAERGVGRRLGSGSGGRGGSRSRGAVAGGAARSKASTKVTAGVAGSVAAAAAAAAGASSSGAGTTAEEIDDFMIEEAAERLPTRRERRPSGRGQSGRFMAVGSRPGIFQATAFERAFPNLTSAAPPSCECAFEQAAQKPRWEVDAEAEVSFIGKGFEGSWSHARVVLLDGRNHVLVRYSEFVDDDGSPLVERMPIERLRVPPPTKFEGWAPVLGEAVEGLWNDCWWDDL